MALIGLLSWVGGVAHTCTFCIGDKGTEPTVSHSGTVELVRTGVPSGRWTLNYISYEALPSAWWHSGGAPEGWAGLGTPSQAERRTVGPSSPVAAEQRRQCSQLQLSSRSSVQCNLLFLYKGVGPEDPFWPAKQWLKGTEWSRSEAFSAQSRSMLYLYAYGRYGVCLCMFVLCRSPIIRLWQMEQSQAEGGVSLA